MSEETLTLSHNGPSNPDAAGAEVILLGLLGLDVERSPRTADVEIGPGWGEMSAVDVGPAAPEFPLALKSTGGDATLTWRRGLRLLLLSHPWSGRLKVHGPAERVVEIDLNASDTRILEVDPEEGTSRPIAGSDAFAGAFLPVAQGEWQQRTPSERRIRPKPDTLSITALGAGHPAARGDEVILLRAEPCGHGMALDLAPFAGRAGWRLVEDLEAGERQWRGVAKGTAGSIELPIGLDGRIVLLRHPWSGQVALQHEETRVEIDLYASETNVLDLTVAELARYATAQNAVGDAMPKEHAALLPSMLPATGDEQPEPERVPRHLKSEFYARRVARIDPTKPVALYVPRWRGVAFSTLTLFEQCLPVPAGREEHPEEIGQEDVQDYARILAETGARHFVISGGDLFNLKLVDAVQALIPDARFDLLWHSNFLQMGEEHDWNLLRHWLHALRDGQVTRVGVVKAGLEQWFAGLGIEAVHVPNIVPIENLNVDPAQTAASRTPITELNADPSTETEGHAPSLGLWLSGSSPYRKTPLAALAAIPLIPGARLRAAGLDEVARHYATEARLPFERIWPEPLPRSVLHRQMRETTLTLYVTLSECAPMLPLESFALGVPCIIGPASDLFRDDEVLREALVVTRPLSPAAIAERAQDVIARRSEVLERFVPYHAAITARSRTQLEALTA
ncbi:MAG: hypothetical protein AAF565_08215 [Pseudomonadota bacterium]